MSKFTPCVNPRCNYDVGDETLCTKCMTVQLRRRDANVVESTELLSLRAYRDKTEEALLAYCYLVKRAFDESEAMLVSGRTREIWSTFKEAAKIDRDGLTDLGLWREPPKDGGA